MPKEFYKVSYKTYLNDRIKPVLFQRKPTYPLYIQLTYDRKTSFFRSYYFDVFAQPKYDHLRTTISQIDELESRVISYVTNRYSAEFSLHSFSSWYQLFNKDILDSLENPFKEWLIAYFEKGKLPGHAALLRHGMREVSACKLLDEFKIYLAPGLNERLIAAAVTDAPPYIPIAAYILHRQPSGPFCLPLYEWLQPETQTDVKGYIDKEFSLYDMGRIIKAIKDLLRHKHNMASML